MSLCHEIFVRDEKIPKCKIMYNLSQAPFLGCWLSQMDNDVIAEHFNAHNKIPAGFAAIADDMAPMAALLCSPLARYIVGQNIVIDGGQHHSLF